MSTQSVDHVKQILEDVERETLCGLQWFEPTSEYLQIQTSAGWEEGMAGVRVDAENRVWIDGDVIAETVQDQRVEALLEAGYSMEMAQSQKMGYDEEEARMLLD